jgi:DNA-directed RNA polymerase subunit E'/Rpb7
MRIERRADDVCAAFLLERELAERGAEAGFEGEVSGLVRSGAFVGFGGELGDVYEGFLPARLLGGAERFELNQTETALVGGESKRRLRLGDPISVRVSGVEAVRGRVDLEPVDG